MGEGPEPTDGLRPQIVSERVEVPSIAGADIWAGTGTWRREAQVTSADTGFPRNHNAGIARTVHGTLPAGGSIDVQFTRSHTWLDQAAVNASKDKTEKTLFTYNLWSWRGTLS